jgi:hypothetical protein
MKQNPNPGDCLIPVLRMRMAGIQKRLFPYICIHEGRPATIIKEHGLAAKR